MLIRRSLLAAAVLFLFAQSAQAKPPPAPLPQLAGTYDGVHRDWRDTVRLNADGSFARGGGDAGSWTFDGKLLSLRWKKWAPETLEFRGPGRFEAPDGHLALTLRDPPRYEHIPGVYEGIHHDWKDRVTLNPDGTFARGNGDPGVWIFDGSQLVLYWKNWGPAPMNRVGPGEFADGHGFRIRKLSLEPTPERRVIEEQPVPGPGEERDSHRGNHSRYIGTDRRTYRVGETVVVHYRGMPGSGTDWTNVVPAGEAADSWGNWEYTNGTPEGARSVTGLKVGEYEARAYFSGGTDLKDRVRFDVVP